MCKKEIEDINPIQKHLERYLDCSFDKIKDFLYVYDQNLGRLSRGIILMLRNKGFEIRKSCDYISDNELDRIMSKVKSTMGSEDIWMIDNFIHDFCRKIKGKKLKKVRHEVVRGEKLLDLDDQAELLEEIERIEMKVNLLQSFVMAKLPPYDECINC